MLDLAVIHEPGNVGTGKNLGQILDAMLFYGQVRLIASPALLDFMVRKIGPDDTRALLTHPRIKAVLTPNISGTNHEITPHGPAYYAISLHLTGDAQNPNVYRDPSTSLYGLIGRAGSPAADRKVFDEMVAGLEVRHLEAFIPLQRRRDLIASLITPNMLRLMLEVHAEQSGLPIDQAKLKAAAIQITALEKHKTAVRSVLSPRDILCGATGAPPDWASIMQMVNDYAVHLYLAQRYSADLIAPDIVAEASRRRFDLSLQRAGVSRDDIGLFQETVLEDQPGFGAAFNAGQLSLKDALNIIDKSDKFRSFVDKLPPDASLLREYTRAIQKESKLDQPLARAIRFIAFAVAGTFASGAGAVGLNAVDSFIVDKVLRGWKPNMFVSEMRKAMEKSAAQSRS